jgi:hypothetical protein
MRVSVDEQGPAEAIEVERRHRRGLAGAAFQVPGGDPHGEA